MQEITDLERRITAALERIGRGIEGIGQSRAAAQAGNKAPISGLDAGSAATGADEILAALEEERMANAQLQERLRALRDKQAAESRRHSDELTALQDELQGERQEMAVQREQIDRLEQELAALRTERRAEADAITEIVAALNPLIEEARHA